MKLWLREVKKDLSKIPDFLDYYDKEYLDAKAEVRLSGSLQRAISSLPHLTEHRFTQLQDIEAVLEHLNIQYKKLQSEVWRKWFENQKAARSLTARDADRYVDADCDVNDLAELINEVALTRNSFLGILKGLDAKNYQMSNITKLKCSGLDDASL